MLRRTRGLASQRTSVPLIAGHIAKRGPRTCAGDFVRPCAFSLAGGIRLSCSSRNLSSKFRLHVSWHAVYIRDIYAARRHDVIELKRRYGSRFDTVFVSFILSAFSKIIPPSPCVCLLQDTKPVEEVNNPYVTTSVATVDTLQIVRSLGVKRENKTKTEELMFIM